MKKIVLTAAALLIAAGSAYAAGSGRTIQVPGNDLSQAAAVDTTTTSSVLKELLNPGSAANQADQNKADHSNQSGYGPGMWGNH